MRRDAGARRRAPGAGNKSGSSARPKRASRRERIRRGPVAAPRQSPARCCGTRAPSPDRPAERRAPPPAEPRGRPTRPPPRQALPAAAVAGRPERGEDQHDRNGEQPHHAAVQHRGLGAPQSGDSRGHPAADHESEERAADVEDAREDAHVLPGGESRSRELMRADREADQADDHADGDCGEGADPDRAPDRPGSPSAVPSLESPSRRWAMVHRPCRRTGQTLIWAETSPSLSGPMKTTYAETYRRSLGDPAGFWAAAAEDVYW